ncbi:hypothetical protein HDE_09212 [Halotydeus destructor]|nr:hypothetical protein HDE_09212 [Halotydeus destructor]
MDILYLYLVLSYFTSVTTAKKAIERFGGRVPSAPCRIGVSSPSNMVTKVAEGQERDIKGQTFFEFCLIGLDHLNCTIVYMDSLLTGTHDENGTFDGTIGYMQRDEIDYGVPAGRTDTLDHSIVHVGPVVSPSDLIIIAIPKSEAKIQVDLSDVLETMTYTFKEYLLIITAFVSAFLYIQECRFKISRRSRKLEIVLPKIPRLHDIIWKIVELFVDQEYYDTKGRNALRMLWSIFTLSVYVIVYCYLVNYMSVNEVADKPLDTLDSLEDHFSNRFNHVVPILMRNSMSYPLLSAADPQSNLGRLFAKAAVDKENNIVDLGSADPQTMMDLFKRCFDTENRVSLISERFIWHTGVRGVMCGLGSDKVVRVHESSKSFANGIMTTFFNKKSPPQFTKYAEYRFRILSESYLSQQAFRYMSEIMLIIATGSIQSDVLRCWDSEKLVEFDDTVIPTSVKVLKKTIRLYFMTLGFSVLALLCERVYAACQLSSKGRQGHKRTIKPVANSFHRWRPCRQTSHHVRPYFGIQHVSRKLGSGY